MRNPRDRATGLTAALALLAACLATLEAIPPAARAADEFTNFESGQVRPVALTPSRDRLLAVNTPDGKLEVFSLDEAGNPTHEASVAVGLEPVAVAARTDAEAWVVNLLSDSVSIVDLSSSPPRVVRTLLVGDEPRDVVFAGPDRSRAFVTAAHRGQNRPGDPQLTTEGVGRADVWVFDTANLGAALGGTPLTILSHFGDTPRALAVSPDGTQVFAAVFHSGNRTTTLSEALVCNGGASAAPCTVFSSTMPGGLPAPNQNWQGIPGPETGLIVKFDPADSKWKDQLARDWTPGVRFTLPDYDVFRIDATATLPAQTGRWSGVGTILFGMAVNPANGKLYVTNTEAGNEVRFEGTGEFYGSSTVRSRLHRSRVTVIDGASVLPRELNKHIDYAQVPSPAGTAERSLATPTGIAVSADGTRTWVAAFGSAKVGWFDSAALESDAFVPSASKHVELSGGGPSGLVLDDARGRLYVLTRFDNAISVVDTASATEIAHLPIFNPEPVTIVEGRRFLYDARLTSSNGEASCSSCHVFGDLDDLAWDLGDPDGTFFNNPNPVEFNLNQDPDFHPIKGPMTTQSLRGMAGQGPMHWRGDRTAGNDPGGDPLDEKAAFEKFNPAFVGLLGRETELAPEQMAAFADFVLTIKYPPNPTRALDNILTPQQAAGRDVYMNVTTDIVRTCHGCHTLDPSRGFFGTDGDTSFEALTQMFKIPHMRNAYTKVGMFGMARLTGIDSGNNGSKGQQVRGFGFSHDGSIDTAFRFLSASVFRMPAGSPAGAFIPLPTETKQNLEAFVLAFDTDLAPVVGQQVTRTATADAAVDERIDLLARRAAVGECDLVVRVVIGSAERTGRRMSDGRFKLDRDQDGVLTIDQLRALSTAPGGEVTFTCASPGSGRRMGGDRDGDGWPDGVEIERGSDPADAASVPAPAPVAIRGTKLVLADDDRAPIDPSKRKITFKSAAYRGESSGVVVPAAMGTGDPTADSDSGGGATLRVYRADGSASATIPLPAALWTRGPGANPAYRYSDPKRTSGPIKSIDWRDGVLSLTGAGEQLMSLAGAPGGDVVVRLSSGLGFEVCASVAAKPSGATASTEKSDTTAKFIGMPNASTVACPAAP